MYTVRLVQEKDMETLATIMSETFTRADAEKPWDKEHSLNYLSYCMKTQPDLFFGAFDENQDSVGAIAGHIKPWRTAHRCTGGVLFVTIPHQKQGIAKMLIKKLMTEAIEKYNATSFEAVTFAGNEFPLTWYEKIGIVADEDAVLIKGKCADIQSKLSHK